MATRSVDLRQGGRGVLVCVPVVRNGKLSGFLLGVFRDQDLLELDTPRRSARLLGGGV